MTNLLYLPGWTVPDFQIIDGCYHIPATYDVAPECCPKCGVVDNFYKHGTKKQAFVDAPVHGLRTYIEVTRARYRCKECGGTFMQPLPDMEENRRMTRRCRDYIAEQSLLKPNTHVADDVGINEKVVRQIFQEHSEALEKRHRMTQRAPRILGIDELRIGKDMCAIFTDIETSWPIELLPSRSQEVVVHFLSHLRAREQVEVVTIDMWRPYLVAVNYAMPNAVVVVDKWHVQRMANDAMETARRIYQARINKKERLQLKRGKSIFLKPPYKLTELEELSLDGWLKNIPELKGAYETKEAFKAIWEHKTADAAQKALYDWRASIPADLKPLFNPLVSTTKNWEKEILNYFDHGRFTNAPTEARNRVVKMTNRLGAGYTFDSIRARSLFGKRSKEKAIEMEAMVKCDYCHALFDPSVLEKTHVVPMSHGGEPTLDNQRKTCPTCHRFHTMHWFKPRHDSTR